MRHSLNGLASALLMLSLFFSCKTNLSDTAGHRCDALDSVVWEQSVWISAVDAPVVTGKGNDRAADGASWFVSDITNSGKLVSAKWMTAGLGVYDLYVNGKLVGEEFLKPGFTHYIKTKRSFTYDIIDALDCSKGAVNVLSAQVTPGWWADKIITPAGHDGMVGKKCAFRAVLELTYADGSVELIGTDTDHWKAGIAGPVRHAAIFDGEDYDARELPGYECSAQFCAPEVNTEFDGEILPSDGAEIYMRDDIALSPVQAYAWKGVEGASDDEYGKVRLVREFDTKSTIELVPGETVVIDFGQNCAAVPSFIFKAEEGTELLCLPAELLNDGNGAMSRGMDGPEGSVHRLNLRTPDTGMILRYTFADSDSYVSYRPRCTFFGYRYVSLTATGAVSIKEIKSVPVTSIAAELETGFVTTGDTLVNKLISNTVWGQRSNYLSVPTDCPQRNERLGWTADTQVFSETGTFFANTDAFFHKWTRDLRDTQSPSGAFPGVAPLAQYGAEPTSMMRLGWADAGVIVPWTIWKQFADTDIIDENWEAMERYMEHVDSSRYDHNALRTENGNYQWADWLSYEPMESWGGSAFTIDSKGSKVPLPESIAYWNYLGASYWAIDASLMCDMAAATGRDEAKYKDMTARAKDYLRSEFLNDKGEFKEPILNTMQTPVLFALKNGLLEGDALDAAKTRLREHFAAHDDCLQTGFLGTSILMETLTDNGMADIAYNLLFQRKNPSWLYSVDNGATTIWERWNSYMIEKGMGPKGMNSFNHYAYGCVCAWIWKTVCGISADPANPGFKHIIMKPVPDKRLGFVKAEYKSAAGLIRSEWRYEGDVCVWTFTVPKGATASVTLPSENEATEYTSGIYVLSFK